MLPSLSRNASPSSKQNSRSRKQMAEWNALAEALRSGRLQLAEARKLAVLDDKTPSAERLEHYERHLKERLRPLSQRAEALRDCIRPLMTHKSRPRMQFSCPHRDILTGAGKECDNRTCGPCDHRLTGPQARTSISILFLRNLDRLRLVLPLRKRPKGNRGGGRRRRMRCSACAGQQPPIAQGCRPNRTTLLCGRRCRAEQPLGRLKRKGRQIALPPSEFSREQLT